MSLSHTEFTPFAYKPSNISSFYRQRKIIFCDEINETSCFEFVNCIESFISHDKKLGIKEPITIEINSGGGQVYYGLTMISTIEKLKNLGYKVITKNIGVCASMAFVLSICGTERVAYKNSVYMYHDISSIAYGKLQYMKEEIEDLKKLKCLVDDIVVKYTDITLEDIGFYCIRKLDRYFYINEAVEKKIVDIVE